MVRLNGGYVAVGVGGDAGVAVGAGVGDRVGVAVSTRVGSATGAGDCPAVEGSVAEVGTGMGDVATGSDVTATCVAISLSTPAVGAVESAGSSAAVAAGSGRDGSGRADATTATTGEAVAATAESEAEVGLLAGTRLGTGAIPPAGSGAAQLTTIRAATISGPSNRVRVLLDPHSMNQE